MKAVRGIFNHDRQRLRTKKENFSTHLEAKERDSSGATCKVSLRQCIQVDCKIIISITLKQYKNYKIIYSVTIIRVYNTRQRGRTRLNLFSSARILHCCR